MPQIRLDVYASDAATYVATTHRVASLSWTAPLDDVGTITFSLPRGDPAAGELITGRYLNFYVDNTFVAQGRMYEVARRELVGGTLLMVQTFSSLADLMLDTAEDSQWVDTALSTILGSGAGAPPGLLNGLAPAWALSIEAGPGAVLGTHDFADEDLLTAFKTVVAENLDAAGAPLHWWANVLTRTIYVGVLGAASGLRLASPQGPAPDGTLPTVVLEYLEERGTGEIVNSLDAYGGNDGDHRLPLPFPCAVGAYAVQSRASRNGGTIYYVEDAASVAAYGRRRRVWTLNPANTQNLSTAEAQAQLYRAACSYLARQKDPHYAWAARAAGDALAALTPGQSVALWMHDVQRSTTPTGSTLTEPLTLNETAYITKVETIVDAGGISYVLELGDSLDFQIGSSPAELIGRAIARATVAAGRRDTTRVITAGAIPTGGYAPLNAQYVVMAADGTLPNERIITAGADIIITDAGAGGAVTISVDGAALHDPVTLSADADANLLALTGQEIGLDDQVHNFVFAGPAVGGPPAPPTFRSLVADDLPAAYAWLVGGNAEGATLVGGTTDDEDVHIGRDMAGAGTAYMKLDLDPLSGDDRARIGRGSSYVYCSTDAAANQDVVGLFRGGGGTNQIFLANMVGSEVLALQCDDVIYLNSPGVQATTLGFAVMEEGTALSLLVVTSTGSTINDGAADMDVRIEGVADANLLFTDADKDKVGIGTNAPLEKLDVHGNIQFGAAVAATDYYLKCDGETNDGVLTWMEDEDYWQFADGVMIPAGEQIYFRDTAIYIHSNADGYLDLVADTGIRCSTLTDTRVVYAGASGLLSGEAAFAYDATNDQLQLSTSGAAAGILLGGDAQWYRNAANVMRTPDSVVADGTCYIGDTANANVALGLTINQGAADNEILALKSSDIAHGMTDITETDTYGLCRKLDGATGGLLIDGLTEVTRALFFRGMGVTDDTTKTTAGNAYIHFRASKQSGTTVGACGADANLVVFQNHSTTRFIFDAEGSAHADVEWTTFDEHDDVALLGAVEDTLLALRDPVKAEFGDWLNEHGATLERAGLVHFDRDNPGHAMINTTRMMMLLVGAIRQLARRSSN